MSLETVYFVSQIVAAVAIVGSLLFVGLQMRHADKTQRALMHQATIQRTIKLNEDLVIEPRVLALVMKAREPLAEWSSEEIWQMRAMVRVLILHAEDMQWQYQAGLLDAAAFESVLTVMRAMFSLPGLRICWQMVRPRVSQADRELVEELLLKDVPDATLSDLSATWRTIATRMYPPAA